MKLILFLTLLIIQGCHSNDKEHTDLATKSMLSFSYSNEYRQYDPKLLSNTPPPRTQIDYNYLRLQSSKGDSNSSLLLFHLFYISSNCNFVDLNNVEPTKRCLRAIDYLNKSIDQNPDNSLALYEMAVLHHRGIGFSVSRKNAIKYLEKVINKGGKDSDLACEYIGYIYYFNDDGEGKDIEKMKYYFDLGAKKGGKICLKNLKDTMELSR
ncbi:TPA: sel1 repeat family protein [Providencia alcalifaciens]|uniref:Sel1 repeat family protein n=1 Tax=Providencia alcalifaciens TaxID=126385 RepID=A0AAW9VEK5_9GAMM|nr:sel1 repeat family protein [Providencia alcalifaciens]EUD06689.1 Sel1 repeat protein [Providencia alcalifaciens R90-1475]MTC31692.1 sel1 repeat family protein [Providencia alcalifaciens]MTC36513.1 sel1 repeat family protein [Providencia alcalifaciens]CAG9413051.1 hypothetical protein NVI2019_NGLDDFDA_00926 [Providencia alcalifaciens]